MSEQNMDPKKKHYYRLLCCRSSCAHSRYYRSYFTTGALNQVGTGSSSNTVSYSDTERFSQGISIEGIDISGMTEEAMEALLQAEVYQRDMTSNLL